MFEVDGFEVRFVKSKMPFIAIGLLLILLATPFFLPSVVYQNILENRLEAASGLDVEFEGRFNVTTFPNLIIEAEDIVFSGQVRRNIEIVGAVRKLKADLKILQFLAGNLHLEDFLLVSPKVTINGDFTPLLPEWLRSQLGTARKQDVRYFELIQYFLENSVIENAQISEGSLHWNQKPNKSLTAQKLNIQLNKPKEGKDLKVSSNVYLNERSVDFKLRLQRPDDFLRGFRSRLTLNIDSAPLRVEFIGSAAKRSTFVSQGDLRVDIPSLSDYCNWLAYSDDCPDQATPLLIKTELKLRDQKLQIENAKYIQTPFIFSATGAIDFKPTLPEIMGTVTFPIQPIGHVFSTSIQRSFNFKDLFLDAFDANVDFKYQGIRLPSGVLIQPRVKATLNDGRLSLNAHNIKAFDGLTNMRFRWYEGVDGGYMDLRIDANNINLEQAQKDLLWDFKMTGTLKTGFEIQSEGASFQQLLQTARTHGDYSILDGSLKHPNVAKALAGEKSTSLEFAEIKGRLDGRHGQINSNEINVIAPSVHISGTGHLDLIKQFLNIRLNSDQMTSATKKQGSGFVRLAGPLNEIQLATSLQELNTPQISDDQHSGLIPIEEKGPLDTEEIVIEETDLLD
ncbi:AsmA-like C-terminal region-containing protein [Terasakiella sp. SH-1]|uniref:AsmA family protein n=1 Tax=Terasakiella sp. SH-1 TaxID=2560057 RepID=UPI00107357CA|nr:AsmA-like C-terminal region-containing protein [Terasakiella sp. SH-1]